MKKRFFKCMIILFSVCLAMPQANAQTCDPLDSKKLRIMLEQLGYTIKDLVTTPGSEKYEVKHKSATFDVPVGYEISPSKNFIWLTVFLGPAKSDTSVTHLALLKQNAIIQPCFFYVSSKGNLMMGVAVENRGVTNAVLRRHIDKIIADVSSTATYWQK
jgi:hypothetical protein